MKILFIDSVHEILEQRLNTLGAECIDGTTWTRKECMEQIEDIEGIVIRSRFRMDKDFLVHAPNLKFIARSGAGMENIDITYTESRNIKCFNAPEGNRNAVAEHALGMLLSLFNKLNKCDTEVRKGIWKREENRGIELEGKTVGIIGFGNNGQAFSKVLSGFNIEIIAFDKYKTGFGNDKVQEVNLEELQSRADVVSLHIPQTEETKYLIDDTFVNNMEQPFYLINLSRGKIVKTDALVNAIKSNKILGACLDVLEYESSSFEDAFSTHTSPSLDYILKSDKVILSPHVGGWTHESYYKLSNTLANKIIDEFF